MIFSENRCALSRIMLQDRQDGLTAA